MGSIRTLRVINLNPTPNIAAMKSLPTDSDKPVEYKHTLEKKYKVSKVSMNFINYLK